MKKQKNAKAVFKPGFSWQGMKLAMMNGVTLYILREERINNYGLRITTKYLRETRIE
jgi:hypothetical protein